MLLSQACLITGTRAARVPRFLPVSVPQLLWSSVESIFWNTTAAVLVVYAVAGGTLAAIGRLHLSRAVFTVELTLSRLALLDL